MTGDQIRAIFVDYFESNGHKHVRSSSLVPHNDPTILFTNAGMNQFKDYFLGNQVPEFKRAVTVQKVMRAGGKHNDLENVGRTDRHHTFFEMLGNFSFGDYFKKEAIEYAWEFLVRYLRLEKERLAVSVYREDDEAFAIWHDTIGVPVEKIGRLGDKDNFWSMGETGPCGPCSEIHYRLRPLPEGKSVQQCLEEDDGTYLEIWNLVFMQYNREPDGTRRPLPKPSIDTGMGLERITSVVQNTISNYGTDILGAMVIQIAAAARYAIGRSKEGDVSCRVIADHLRASAFLIADGVVPSNEGRGYVLRRIVRRAARYGKVLGFRAGFFSNLVEGLALVVRKSYPEIVESKEYIALLLEQEEKRFDATLLQGMKILDALVARLNASGEKIADGAEIFKLYDSFGFPADLAEDVLRDNGFTYDRKAFDSEMEKQRLRAKTAQEGKNVTLKINEAYPQLMEEGLGNSFVGYDSKRIESKISAVLKDNVRVDAIKTGDRIEVVAEETPFYAESGGQVGDRGEIVHDEFRIKIYDTQSPVSGLNIAKGEVVNCNRKEIDIIDCPVLLAVDVKQRERTERNHTATHLLQSALRTVLGEHVKQAGSLVNAEKLRFDFNHYAQVTKDQLNDIEALVNRAIQTNEKVEAEIMPFDRAVDSGAVAIFGEKYGDQVRVLTAGSSSRELCGGCHTGRTGNIGPFAIVGEQAIASGIRRIEAVTGSTALQWTQSRLNVLDGISQRLKVPMLEVEERFRQMERQSKEREKSIEALQKKLQMVAAEKFVSQVQPIGSVDTLILQVEEDVNLKSLAYMLLQHLNSGIILLGQIKKEKISVLIAVTKDLSGRFNAGRLIEELAPTISARGGGRADIAQCGGGNPTGWPELKKRFEEQIEAASR